MKTTTVPNKPRTEVLPGKLFTRLATIIFLLLLTSCGGGISGSGDGDSDTSKEFELIKPYHISNFPISFAAAIPASLIDGEDSHYDAFNESDPASTVMSNVNRLVDRMLAIALAQLYLDTNWETILDYCATTSSQQPCSLSGSGIAALYTSEMALWEANFRSRIEQYQQWYTGQSATEDFQQLYSAAHEKVGTQIPLDSVVLIASDDATDEYNTIVEIDIAIPELVTVTLRWNTDLQSGTFTTQNASTGEQTLLASFTTVDGLMQHKFSLNETHETAQPAVVLYTQELPDSDRSFVASTIKQISGNTTTEIDSQGLADEFAGYLRSDTIIYAGADSSVLSYRQSFEEADKGTASCIPDLSASGCRDDSDWTTLAGEDPALSNSFVSNEEIESIKQSYAIGVTSIRLFVSHQNDVDTYAIIDSTGYDADDFDDLLEDVEDIADDKDLESGDAGITPEYDKLVICRVTNTPSTETDSLDAVCDATAGKFKNVFVVAEDFDDGDLNLDLLQDQDFNIQIIE